MSTPPHGQYSVGCTLLDDLKHHPLIDSRSNREGRKEGGREGGRISLGSGGRGKGGSSSSGSGC